MMRVIENSFSRRVLAARSARNRSWTSGLTMTALLLAGFTLSAAGCGSSSQSDPTPNPEAVLAMRRADSAVAGGAGPGGGTGWGTIKGRFIYNGNPPTPGLAAQFDPAKDAMCKLQVKDETLLVDGGSKGIQNILIYLADADRVHPDFEKAAPAEAV